MQELNSAYKECKFGLFHFKLLTISFIGFIGSIMVSATTSYLLPMAECDLQMSLLQKGLLNAMPFFGMLLSSVIAGFLTDAFGRKIFIVVGYGGIFFFTVIAGLSQTYEVLVSAKFFEGALFATSFSAVITFTPEFCHYSIRDRVMLLQSSFTATSHIVISAMAWGIFANDWKYTCFGGTIVLNTWNIYLLLMSTWSLTACLLYGFFLPESPKFLITKNKYDEARKIIVQMYRTNTRKPADTFMHAEIWKDNVQQSPTDIQAIKEDSFRQQIVIALRHVKTMFQKPMLGFLTIICLLNFLVMCIFNVLRLWYPQLSTIVEHYKKDDNQDMCEMLDAYINNLKIIASTATDSDVCIPTKSGAETYINSIILGCVCLLPYFVTGVLVNKVGKKRLMLVAGFICVGTVFGIRWANTKPAIVALFSFSIAITQIILSLNQAYTVDLFSTTTRTLAISFMMVSGRIGTLLGNIVFPILLEMGCVIPFFTMTGIMLCVTIITFFLPSKT